MCIERKDEKNMRHKKSKSHIYKHFSRAAATDYKNLIYLRKIGSVIATIIR